MHEAGKEPAGAGVGGDPRRWVEERPPRILLAGLLGYVGATAAGVAQYSSGADAVAGYAILAAFCGCFLAMSVWVGRLYWLRWFWPLLGAMVVLTLAEMFFARGYAFYLAAVLVVPIVGRLQAPGCTARRRGSYRQPSRTVGGERVARGARLGPGDQHRLHRPHGVCFHRDHVDQPGASRRPRRDRPARLAGRAQPNLPRPARSARPFAYGHHRESGARPPARPAATRRPVPNEIGEVEELSRHALADVRAAVSNYREVTLAGELARGKELLRASGVTAVLPTATDVIDSTHDELLGWAVREGLTNVARHAHATRCTVTLTPSVVEIADDGVGGAGSCGNGLTGLRERVAAAGGTVEAGPISPRGWRLRVSLEPAGAAPAVTDPPAARRRPRTGPLRPVRPAGPGRRLRGRRLDRSWRRSRPSRAREPA